MSKARGLADLGNVYNDGALSNRNLIINGAMQVNQRGTSTAVTSTSIYTVLDRFEVLLGGSYTVGATVTQASDGPSGFASSFKLDITSTSTPSASNNLLVGYTTESKDMLHLDWGSVDGKYLTISFWVKSNKTGAYGFGILIDNKTRNWLSSYTITSADTWEYKTILIDPDVATAFDNDNNSGLRLNWHLSTGPDDITSAHSWQSSGSYESITGQVDLCDSTSNYFQITGVQLEVGDTATPFEHRSFGQELALCQRYYTKMSGAAANTRYGSGFNYLSTVNNSIVHLPTPMRALGTLTSSAASTFSIYHSGGLVSGCTAIGLDAGGGSATVVNVNGTTSGLTIGGAGQLIGSVVSYLAIDSEL